VVDSRLLCLGDAFVELVCERPAAEADVFVPRLGGTVAGVAVAAARAGAAVGLAGVVGDDTWGRWLRARLQAAGVDAGLFALLPGVRTPLALTTVNTVVERTLYGDTDAALAPALAERLEAAAVDATGLLLSSSTLLDPGQRELTTAIRALALEAGRPVVFHPGLRVERWRSQADAAASANACVPGALLVIASLAEATVMTGEEDPERAALALVKAGARLVALGLGSEGAMLRGELRADVETALPAGRLGAAEIFTGSLLARLALSDFYPPAVAAGLREAVAAAARG
jgi:sugar/nucleoside kinase (ribokinase family)